MKILQHALTLSIMTTTPPYYPRFNHWAKFYNKVYKPTEHDYRNYVFNTNLEHIYLHNTFSNATWTMAVNKFADMTPHEWSATYLGLMNNTNVNRSYSLVNATKESLPDYIDWTERGAVTYVKDQGDCGSCWAFSTTGALESAWFLKNGSLYNISAQQLIDCSTVDGCNGGSMDNAFQYVIDNKGLMTDEDYTASGPNVCRSDKVSTVTATGFKYVIPNSETTLMSAIMEQPISVAVEADPHSFQFYSSGVMTKECGTNLNHGVLVVGYGTDSSGQDYYKVKNSLGSYWGMSGYILLGRGNVFGAEGQCGIQMAASFPIV